MSYFYRLGFLSLEHRTNDTFSCLVTAPFFPSGKVRRCHFIYFFHLFHSFETSATFSSFTRIFFFVPHSTTGEPVTMLHPTGHTVLQESQRLFYTLQATQYYRRAWGSFTPYRPHMYYRRASDYVTPYRLTQYYRRASDYVTPYRPHSTTGEPVTSHT